jgi:hypothetical protein
VPYDCRYRLEHGFTVCVTACAAYDLTHVFRYARVETPGDLPDADRRVVDIALLDMHHGWPNLGHDALVHAIQSHVCDLRGLLQSRSMAVRVISYDVRRSHAIPDRPGERHEVYVGTGGPGHLDPRRNDGRAEGAQGIVEDPGWEAPLFALFDAIASDEHAAIFGVCHTFGVMCRWLDIAQAVMRPPSKGGKSAGIVDNVLTASALTHPWFGRFAARLPDQRHFPVLDSRLYDLVPHRSLGGVVPLSHESIGHHGVAGEALTMIEVARGTNNIPRVLAVNHHPEVVNRDRQLTVLQKKRERGEVDEEWIAERMRTLQQPVEDEAGEQLLQLTSSYTLLAPLRAQVYRAIERRAADLGVPLDQDAAAATLVYDPDAQPTSLELDCE